MDAVELEIPAVVKLMGGPEGFGGAGGGGGAGGELAAEKAEVCHSRSSINGCSTLVSKKDGACADALESALRNKIHDATNHSRSGQIRSFHEKDASAEVNFGSMNTSLLRMSSVETKQLQQRPGKVARTSSGSSKRSRVVQIEISALQSSADDVKGMPSEPAKYNITERGHMPKQKNNSNSKRGDKRNGKIPKSKSDSFCLKNGLMSFASAAGGSNFLGINGSKPDLFDFTEHVDELSLDELLDGSYKCPIYAKEKGKKVVSNENLLHSIRKAWSTLRLQKSLQPQDADIDNGCNQKASTGLLSAVSSSGSEFGGDKGGILTASQSCDKDYSENLKTQAIMVDSPLHHPKDVLERLALSPSKELDYLLVDAAKPAFTSRNSADQRLGKPVSCRTGLPPFPWSHSSSAHCKSGPDAVKLSAARNTCQGRCVKVENSLTPLKDSTGLSVDMESLTFDQSLVPVARTKSAPSEIKKAPSSDIDFSVSDRVLSSLAACSTSQVPPVEMDEHSPRVLVAAQTLYDIAISLKQTPHVISKSLNYPSERAVKSCKLKMNEKSKHQFLVPKSTVGPDSLAKADHLYSSKKLKLSEDVKKNDINLANSSRKGPVSWSAPRSIRSSPSKLYRESVRENKSYNINIVKKSGMMPPPSRAIDKACSSQPKARKVVPIEWNPSGSKGD